MRHQNELEMQKKNREKSVSIRKVAPIYNCMYVLQPTPIVTFEKTFSTFFQIIKFLRKDKSDVYKKPAVINEVSGVEYTGTSLLVIIRTINHSSKHTLITKGVHYVEYGEWS